jgi:hypothetical protein
LHGYVHVRQQPRVVQMVERGVEKPIGGLRGVEAPQAQQSRDDRMELERSREHLDARSLAVEMIPDGPAHRLVRLGPVSLDRWEWV